MRFFLFICGTMFASMVSDALTKSFQHYYLHENVPAEIALREWVIIGCTLGFALLSLTLLRTTQGKVKLFQRPSPYPAPGETMISALFFPLSLTNGVIFAKQGLAFTRSGLLPSWAFAALGLLSLFYAALLVLQFLYLARDAYFVQRFGWRRLAQMEANRLQEKCAGQ